MTDVDPIGIPKDQDDEGGLIMIATDVDRRLRQWTAYAETDPDGVILGCFVTCGMSEIWRGGPAPARAKAIVYSNCE